MEVRFGKEKFDFDRVGCGLFCGNSEIVCNNAISDMLCQVVESDKVQILYLIGEDTFAGAITNSIGKFINVVEGLELDVWESLQHVVKQQSNFRHKLLLQHEVNNIKKVKNCLVKSYCIDGKWYMPDDILFISNNDKRESLYWQKITLYII